MEQPKVSVIIPVYKTEQFLERCLDSVVSQTLKEIEIICVDDGSPDRSIEILNRYAACDDRISVISQENRGLGGARNRGYKVATGEYVLFVDSDDWIDAEYCKRLYETAVAKNADVAVASICKVRTRYSKWVVLYECCATYTNPVDKLSVCQCPKTFYVVNKMIRRRLLEQLNLLFREKVCYEDVDYVVRILCESKTLVTVPDVVYWYVVNPNGITKSLQTLKKQQDKYEAHKFMVEYLDSQNVPIASKYRRIPKRSFMFLGICLFAIKEWKRIEWWLLFNGIPIWRRRLLPSANSKPHPVANGTPRIIGGSGDDGLTIAFDAKRITHNATGLGNYSRTIIKMLLRYAPTNNRYLLYTPDPGQSRLRNCIVETSQVRYCYPRRNSYRWLGKKLGLGLWRSIGIIKELPEDLSLFHGLTGELPFHLPKYGIRSVVTVHDLIFLRWPSLYSWIDRRIYAYKCRKACKEANRIIAISEMTKRDIISFFHIDEGKIDVVYQSCDERFKQRISECDRRAVRMKYDLPDRFILSVGTIEERKNLLLILRAMARIAMPLHLVAVGRRTPYTKLVEQYAEIHGLSSQLHIRDSICFDDLPAIYQMADVFIYPSRYEGFGIPMIEAANCQVPIIGAVGSTLEEAGGPGAIYVDPDDPQMLANYIEKILSDEKLRCRMIDQSKAYVARFDPENIVQDLLNVYYKALGRFPMREEV